MIPSVLVWTAERAVRARVNSQYNFFGEDIQEKFLGGWRT